MNIKTCVVTGGAGFIGSHICDALLARHYTVICIDNLITGTENNITHLISNPDFRFIRHDVTERYRIDQHIDAVFHLASPASVPDYQRYPEETALVNSVGTLNMLKLAKENNARFLYSSTSEVYGDPKEHPQKESYWGNVNPNGVRACYDEAKRFGEMLVMLYHRNFGVNTRIIRIFNTYGPRMRKTDGRVISNLANQAIEGRPLTVYGDGFQTRSYCYISDLVEGMMKAMLADKTDGSVINLGNPDEYTVNELSTVIVELTGVKSPIEYRTLPQDDPLKRKPDITVAKRLLGWEPKIGLREGLEKTIEWYRGSGY